jgi:hypothetical protein
MSPAIEKALILTYKWVRKKNKNWSLNSSTKREIIGVFINFVLQQDLSYEKGCLDTRDFDIALNSLGYGIIKVDPRYRGWGHSSDSLTRITSELESISEYNFYTIWLRSSFENSSNYSSIDIIDYISIEINNIMEPFAVSYFKG